MVVNSKNEAVDESTFGGAKRPTDREERHNTALEQYAEVNKHIRSRVRWLYDVERGHRESGGNDPARVQEVIDELKPIRDRWQQYLSEYDAVYRKKLRGLINKLNKLKNWCDREQGELLMMDYLRLGTPKQRRHRRVDFESSLTQLFNLYDSCQFDTRYLDSKLKKALDRVTLWVTEYRRRAAMTPRDRQLEGIARVKDLGLYKGRPKMSQSLQLKIKRRLKAGKPKTAIAEELGISRMTVHRVAKKYKPREFRSESK